jgi:hypothetical protein
LLGVSSSVTDPAMITSPCLQLIGVQPCARPRNSVNAACPHCPFATTGDLLAYRREYDGNALLIALNLEIEHHVHAVAILAEIFHIDFG